MALSVKIYNSAFPDGHEFGVAGLGVFKNGEEREVSENEERAFASFYQQDPTERLTNDEAFEVSGTSEIDNLDEILGQEISDTVSPDPTAMNIDPATGEVFADANISGAVTNPETEQPVEPETTTTPVTTNPVPNEVLLPSEGGGE